MMEEAGFWIAIGLILAALVLRYPVKCDENSVTSKDDKTTSWVLKEKTGWLPDD